MDSQPSLALPEYVPEQMSLLRWANLLLPTDEFATTVSHFPGTNAHAYWAEKGHFFISFIVYDDGKEIGRFHTKSVSETGYLEVNFDDFISMFGRPLKGLIVAEYHHHEKIFPELYFSHTHRKTGAYVAYPSQVFMGDQIFPAAHTTELENALFWPGTGITQRSEISFFIINPYDIPSFSQISLFLTDGRRRQTDAVKIPPRTWRTFSLAEIFPEQYEEISSGTGQCSFCIASQHKTVALVVFRDRDTGALTTIDHLHKFSMY